MKTSLYVLASLGLAALAQGQTAPAKPDAVPAAVLTPSTAPKASTSGAAASAATKSKDTISVDFSDEEIRTVLRNVADLFDLNLVIPDTLQGRTSLKLHDVTWRQIFQVVLSPAGYTYVEENNIIKIVSQDSLAQEPAVTEVFVLNYATAADVQKTIDPLVKAVHGSTVTDARTNSLVVTAPPSAMSKVEPLIQKLDKATAQVMIESKFIEVDDTDVTQLGVDWTSLGQVGGTASVGTGGTLATPTPVTLGNYTMADSYGKLFTSALPMQATFNSTTLALYLNALQTKTKSRVVNNPTVVTLNNTEAKINIGYEYPIPQYTYNQQTGTFAISGFEFKDIGTLLTVTPQVNDAGFIRLTLAPEISSVFQPITLGQGAGGATIPELSVQKVTTTVTLADGNTLGIGGLIKTQKTTTINKVPFLGSIPFLGRLFRNDNPNTSNQNLLIFITARIISTTDASVSQVFDPRAIHAAGLKKSDLPGYRPTNVKSFLPENAPVPDEASLKQQ